MQMGIRQVCPMHVIGWHYNIYTVTTNRDRTIMNSIADCFPSIIAPHIILTALIAPTAL
ncbi:MAG: hypothetical protein Q8908_08610 [Bacteroidota bacterium]|nr:hypothetical protein [Bacteroidota bacterium]